MHTQAVGHTCENGDIFTCCTWKEAQQTNKFLVWNFVVVAGVAVVCWIQNTASRGEGENVWWELDHNVKTKDVNEECNAEEEKEKNHTKIIRTSYDSYQIIFCIFCLRLSPFGACERAFFVWILFLNSACKVSAKCNDDDIITYYCCFE